MNLSEPVALDLYTYNDTLLGQKHSQTAAASCDI